MDGKNLAILITGFIMILIGISLIGVVATEGQKKTTTVGVVNEAIDISVARTSDGRVIDQDGTNNFTLVNAYTGDRVWKVGYSDCNIAGRNFTNGTIASIGVSTFIPSSDYALSTKGILTLYNTVRTNTSATSNSNTTYLSYAYCPNDYLTESWSRTVLNLVPGFFAIAILLIGVGMMFQVLRNEGLINV